VFGQRRSSYLAPMALLVWTALVIWMWIDHPNVPRLVLPVLRYGIPAISVAFVVFSRHEPMPKGAKIFAAGTAIVAGALFVTPIAMRSPRIVAGVITVLLVVMATRRWPGMAIVALFVVSGVSGSMLAFTPIPPRSTVDVFLVALLLAMVLHVAGVRADWSFIPSPAVLIICVYLVVTIVATLFSSNVGLAFESFRAGGWTMLAIVPVAYGAWPESTLKQVRFAIVLICLVVGAYAAVRWQIGPASQEESLLVRFGESNYDFVQGTQKVQGSFVTGAALGHWVGIVLPFCVSAVFLARKKVRGLALAAAPLLVLGLFASQSRAGLVAGVVGVALALTQVWRVGSLRAPRLVVMLVVAVVLVIGGALLFSVVVQEPALRDRYAGTLAPDRDPAVQARLERWRAALDDADDYPFGRGLGTAHSGNRLTQRFSDPNARQVDSSYVQIAYEQGFVVMLVFIAALLILLIEVWRRGSHANDREQAWPAIGALGTAAAVVIEFAAGQYFHNLLALAAWVIIGVGLAPLVTVRHAMTGTKSTELPQPRDMDVPLGTR
jgi:hypothetical protein